MKRYGKRLVSVALVMVMLLTMLPTSASELNGSGIQNQIVSDELLGVMGVNYEELVSGDYEDSGETYSCIIWIEDIDMEQAVRAGIDAAEMTRVTYSMNREYEYPYEVMNVNGQKVIEVNLKEDENDTYVQTYINTERATAAEMYADKNGEFVADTFSARIASVNYVSSYSPCVFADLTVDEIAELLAKDEVQRIGYWNEEKVSNTAIVEQFTSDDISDLETQMGIIAVDRAKSLYGVSGSGVKIGQYELACSRHSNIIRNPDFNNIDIEGNEDYHADNVHTIMRAVAPNATYYASGMYADNTTDTQSGNYAAHIEWLLGQGVNIINYSAGGSATDSYDSKSQWLDHIAYNHDVHFVKSAGNSGANGISSPGMAYNIITVGYTWMTSPYYIHSSSSYFPGTVSRVMGRTFKPDVVAPGTYRSGQNGSSYSTPLVTGTIALLCEYSPALKTKQHIVKAILAASTGKETRKYRTTDSNFRMYGAGMIDARAAIWVTGRGNYCGSTGTVSSSSPTMSYNMNVTSSDTVMRIALAYANRVKFDSSSGHTGDISAGMIGELKLEIFSPSGTLITSCETAGANLKVVEFNPNGVYGTYTIKVTQVTSASGNRATNFGVAWR